MNLYPESNCAIGICNSLSWILSFCHFYQTRPKHFADWRAHNLIHGDRFGNDLVVDCRYEHMLKRNTLLKSRYLTHLGRIIRFNSESSNPFRLWFCKCIWSNVVHILADYLLLFIWIFCRIYRCLKTLHLLKWNAAFVWWFELYIRKCCQWDKISSMLHTSSFVVICTMCK